MATLKIRNETNDGWYEFGHQGAQGYQGHQGPQGDQGLRGFQGYQGDRGYQGYQGNQGIEGAQGDQGSIGPQGSQGSAGPQGYQGNQGSTGSTGTQGPAGEQGATGTTGPQGSIGAQGPVGAQGDQGPAGDQGATGNTGPQGSTGAQGSAGPQGNQGLTGAQGSTGSVGPQGYQGNQGSAGADGTDGAQGPIGETGAQGAQGSQGSIGATGSQGPQGDTGATGSTGAQGTQGAQGPQGLQGLRGYQGYQGRQGYQGTQGTTGATGAQGSTGSTGPQGSEGAEGPQGHQGYQGANGSQGAQGAMGPEGIVWRGDWATSTAYNQDDAVHYDGDSYICLTGHTSSTPPPNANWSMLSQEGAIGPQGPQGLAGAQGPTGPQGNQGAIGAQGSTGATGAQGAQGNQGAQGLQGLKGAQGDTGDQGETGPTGPQGNQGSQGNQGPTGSTGATGPQGNQGAVGSQGATGATGSQGATGPQGATGSAGAQGPQGEVGAIGPTGPQGNQGAVGAQGTAGPQGVQGETGDQGATGPQGNQGAVGNQGATGAQGATGSTGPQGNQGVQGSQGLIGETGPTGPQGYQGVDGPQGYQGNQGSQGPIGVQGSTGPQGNQGAVGPQGDQGAQGLLGDALAHIVTIENGGYFQAGTQFPYVRVDHQKISGYVADTDYYFILGNLTGYYGVGLGIGNKWGFGLGNYSAGQYLLYLNSIMKIYGEIHATSGELGDLSITGDLTVDPGNIIAGDGAVTLNANGIALSNDTQDFYDNASIRFLGTYDPAHITTIGSLSGYGLNNTNLLRLMSLANGFYGSNLSKLELISFGPDARIISIACVEDAVGNQAKPSIILSNIPDELTPTDTSIAINSENTYIMGGGLTIGSNAVAGDSNLVVIGTIKDGSGVEYLKSTQKAADSDKLDGQDSTYFQQSLRDTNFVELGYDKSVDAPSYIDFHTIADHKDYDARIIASVGNAVVGNAQLDYYAKQHVFSGQVKNNSGVNYALEPAFSSLTPTITASSGTFTTVSCYARYLTIGKMRFYSGLVIITNAGTATGTLRIPIPSGTPASMGGGKWVGSGFVSSNKSCFVTLLPTQTYLEVLRYDGATAIGTGVSVAFSIMYELA